MVVGSVIFSASNFSMRWDEKYFLFLTVPIYATILYIVTSVVVLDSRESGVELRTRLNKCALWRRNAGIF